MFLWLRLYVDPGSGSILLQVIIAGVTGLVFYVTLTRKRIAAFFKKIFGKNKSSS